MPLFEYRCRKCDTTFEALVSASRTEPVKCESCGSETTEKLFSTFASAGSQHKSAPTISGGGCGSGGFT